MAAAGHPLALPAAWDRRPLDGHGMIRKVLLTGGGGFVGSHVLRHVLTETSWHITCIDSFRHKGITDRIITQTADLPLATQARLTVFTHDLRAPISSHLADAIGPIDYVLHLAAESHVDRSITDPRGFCENNLAVTLTMLEWARLVRPAKFIAVSTDEVFGPAAGDYAHSETDPHKPSNPYAASKAAAEDLCHAWWRTYGLPICVSNTMNIIGELQDSEKYVPMVLARVLAGECVPIHASADGSQIGSRFYLHARNQADALLHLLLNVDFPAYGDGPMARFNIVGEREISNLELAQMIAGFAGKRLKYELVDFHSSRPGHDLRYALDGGKIAATGWKAPVPLEDSLRKTVEWTMAHPQWLA
jgi:dTDP-glucose 4,6-dehydratase